MYPVNHEATINKYIITAVFTIVTLFSHAQSEMNFIVSGVVIDNETQAPLENASVGIASLPMGTLSNTDGQFLLKIPVALKDSSLIISHLGYVTYKHVINSLTGPKNLVIKLKPGFIFLGEVTVHENALDAEEIILKAVARIKDNYPAAPFILEGFFRTVLKEDDRYVHLIEAALKVYDKHFQRRLRHGITEDVQIIEARQSVDYATPLVRQVRKQNEIVDILDQNPVHYQRGLLNPGYFDYKIDTAFQSDKGLVYIISTIPGSHKIYVADETFAILKTIERINEGDEGYEHPEFSLNDSLIVRRMVYLESVSEFSEYNGKMYLKYLNETDAYEMLNKQDRKREFLIESYKEFVVTNIIIADVKPSAKNESYNFKDNIVNKAYNPVFWNNYSTIHLSPLNDFVKRNLEHELPLEEQFMNGNNANKDKNYE